MKLFPLLLALWLQAPAQSPPTAPAAQAPIIEAVSIRGSRRIPPATIKFVILSKPGDRVNPAMVARDIRAIYAAQEAFEDITVTEEEGTNGQVILVFTVKEKPTIRNIEYTGLTSIQVSDVMKALADRKATLSQAQIYDPAKVQKAVQIIKGLLAEKGRAKATVDVHANQVPGSGQNAVLVTFDVNEGPKVKIEKIEFEGNKVFSDGALKKAMKLTKEAGPLTGFTGKDAFHPGKFNYDMNEVTKLYDEKGFVHMNYSDPVAEERTKSIYRTLPFIKPTFPWGIPIPFWKKQVDRVFVTVKIEENDQYRVGEVKVTGGDKAGIPPQLLASAIALRKGDVYNENLLRTSFENLKKFYGRGGYVEFIATPLTEFDEEKKIVNMTVTIDEGKQYFVQRLFFSGNTTTRDFRFFGG
jgi:outer membrane protein insertion porin family